MVHKILKAGLFGIGGAVIVEIAHYAGHYGFGEVASFEAAAVTIAGLIVFVTTFAVITTYILLTD